MERLKNRSLKQAFFAITALYLIVGIFLASISFFACVQIRSQYESGPQVQIMVDENGTLSTQADDELSHNPKQKVQANAPTVTNLVLNALQIILPVFFVMLSLILADISFYRWKLKKPLEVLEHSAARIQKQDLDFTVQAFGNDELGRLCSAFETMRAELLTTNKALWAQVEERRRLNAAFAHDLRNPVTVLKGSAKLLDDGIKKGSLPQENAADIVDLISQYAGRIETYVTAMTNAQKLEELECRPGDLSWDELKSGLWNSLHVLSSGTGIELNFQGTEAVCTVKADRGFLFNVAENLVYNALRYAKSSVSVTLTLENPGFILRVSDDGPGFPESILKKGAAPFLRDRDADSEHFGMGLYMCRLLCKKHGGELYLDNSPNGAVVTAQFN
ncbi:HAMP domain-containing histidine kinase [Blautia schinkii]|nr:HAMP domain-containing histidine kinase [Blautia schinkii]